MIRFSLGSQALLLYFFLLFVIPAMPELEAVSVLGLELASVLGWELV